MENKDRHRECEIKECASNLCKELGSVCYPCIAKRNEKIIKELMEKFNIDYEYAKYCFENNSDRQLIEAKNVETLRKAEMEAGDGSLYPLDGEDQNQVLG